VERTRLDCGTRHFHIFVLAIVDSLMRDTATREFCRAAGHEIS
jgi:hypothetical protein